MSRDQTIVDQDICVRPAHQDDLDRLWAVDVEVFEQLAYPYFVLRQMFDVHRDCWLVAVHPSGLVGYSLGVPTPDRQLAWMLGLAVTPRFRNRGYGRRLTLESLDLLRSMGVPEICLTVEPSNEVALRLYRHVGFAVTGLRRDYLGVGEDRLVMARSLTKPEPSGLASSAIPMPRPIAGAD